MPTKYRLNEEDRARFGGPEWLTFDFAKFGKMQAAELEALEEDFGHPLARVLNAVNGDGSVLGFRALVWIAYQQAGLRISFREFNIQTLQVDVETVPAPQEAASVAPLDDSPAGSETSG